LLSVADPEGTGAAIKETQNLGRSASANWVSLIARWRCRFRGDGTGQG
jgi:hypothetical protein